MAFDYDSDNPLDASYIADFPSNERSHRNAVVSSVNVDHLAETTGFHRKATLTPLVSDPDLSGTNGFVYTKEVAGLTELFYRDETGQVTQLTSDNSAAPDKLPLAGGVVTGTLEIDGGTLKMTDSDVLMEGTSLLKILNAIYLQGRNAANGAWLELLGVDASDITEVGNNSFPTRIRGDDASGAVVEYGSGDKIIYHEGNYTPLEITMYESAPLTLSLSARGTVPHGLGFKPTLWLAVLVCNSNEHDHVIGDEISVMQGIDATVPLTIWANASGFGWNLSAFNPMTISHGAGGALDQLTISKWNLVFRAWYWA